MSNSTRFVKGQSGNPKGRPKTVRQSESAFDVIFDKVLPVTQNGVARDLTVDEALQLQTYQAALKGSRMAIRQVFKMIETRERALAKRRPASPAPVPVQSEQTADNADEAMCILGIAERTTTEAGTDHEAERVRLATWAVQAALSRPGGRRLTDLDVRALKNMTLEPHRLRWPKKRSA